MHQIDLVKTIIERRKSLQVTQELLSDLSEVSLRTIKQIEAGKGNPTISTIYKVLDVLGLSLQVIIKEGK